jgi:hypothetical protein
MADTTSTAAAATDTVVRVGKGTHTHAANADGNTYCGSQGAYRGARRARSATSFMPAGTPVTCTKCNPAAAGEAPAAPAAEARVRCTNMVYGEVCGNMHRPSRGCAACE